MVATMPYHTHSQSLDCMYFHDIYSFDYGGWGTYTDEGTSNMYFINNIVYNTKCAGYVLMF